MGKKGRFKLLSYLIEENLIFYQSLNKNKKIIAFSIFEFNNLPQIIILLNRFLKNKLLNNFSIQIDVNGENKKKILMCFDDTRKNNVIKTFNIIKQNIIDKYNSIDFFKNDKLEKEFLDIILDHVNSNIKLSKIKESILIDNEGDARILDLYNLNLKIIENKISFIHVFLNLINNYNRRGYLILNFRANPIHDIFLSAYFIDIKNQKNNDPIHLEDEVNSFFNDYLLKKHNFNLKDFSYYLFRFNITNDYSLSNNILELFLSQKQQDFNDLNQFNLHLEQKLRNYGLDFNRLNRNLLFIEQKILFLTLEDLDFNLLLRLCKKYYLKYTIYILILNDKEYTKILDVDKIQLLENIKIICYKDFLNFDFKRFKRNLVLENA